MAVSITTYINKFTPEFNDHTLNFFNIKYDGDTKGLHIGVIENSLGTEHGKIYYDVYYALYKNRTREVIECGVIKHVDSHETFHSFGIAMMRNAIKYRRVPVARSTDKMLPLVGGDNEEAIEFINKYLWHKH